MKLKTLEQIVLETLTENPETQKDDFVLIERVYSQLSGGFTIQSSFGYVMQHHADLGLPPFESVRRCRQKVQANHPELVDPSTAKHRHKLIDEYKDYAKDKEVIGTHKIGNKAIIISNDSPIFHSFDIGSTVSFTGLNERGRYNFVNKTGLTQELAPNHFKWLSNDPKPKQAKLIRDNGYFFKIGETISLVDKNDLMGMFTNGISTGWVHLTDIEWIGE